MCACNHKSDTNTRALQISSYTRTSRFMFFLLLLVFFLQLNQSHQTNQNMAPTRDVRATSDSIHLVLRQYCSSIGLVLLIAECCLHAVSIWKPSFSLSVYSLFLAPWESLLQSLTFKRQLCKIFPSAIHWGRRRKKENHMFTVEEGQLDTPTTYSEA